MFSKHFTKEDILEIVIESVITFNPSLLKPCLWSECLAFTAVNKMMFYWYFKGMVLNTKCCSKGALFLKIENNSRHDEIKYYHFFDHYHASARLTIEVIDKGEKVHIDVMPF